MGHELTRSEKSELTRLETVVAEGLQRFVDVGNALLEIRERRLYRDTHATFEEYCRARWKFSKTHANRLILGAQAAIRLGDVEVQPANEAQARPLTALPAAQQAKVWERVVERTGGKPTAADVRAAVREVLKPTEAPNDARFVRRVKILHAFAVWAKKTGISTSVADKVLEWLRGNL